MFHQVAKPGDVFVAANSPMDTLGVHAVKRRDGGLGLLFVNKDAVQNTTVTVTVDGYSYAAKGTRYEWGKQTIEVGKGITETPMDNRACSSHDARSDSDPASLNSWLVKYHCCSFGPLTALKYSLADFRQMYMSCCAHWK